MSGQKSELPLHPIPHPDGNGRDKQAPRVSLSLDPYAAPDVYYGQSHTPRQVAKSRTYSAVSLPEGQPTPGLERATETDTTWCCRSIIATIR